MHNVNISTEFDFDEWVRLAKEDPDAFENMRTKMIQEIIDDTSPEIKHRMQGLQWQIDQIRSTSPNPMSSCLRISQMMWDSVLDEDGLLDHMHQLNDPDIRRLNKPRESATVINMTSRTDEEKS
jgi:uncharacterized protein DUF3135